MTRANPAAWLLWLGRGDVLVVRKGQQEVRQVWLTAMAPSRVTCSTKSLRDGCLRTRVECGVPCARVALAGQALLRVPLVCLAFLWLGGRVPDDLLW